MEIERKRKMDMMPNIPNDIIVEILLRLSAKSLLRLRCVCKYWFDLITRDPHFIKMHLLHHHSTSTTSHYNEIMCIISCTSSDINCTNVDSSKTFMGGRDQVLHVSTEVSTGFRSANPQIMGSCNGLILVNQFESEQLCIWNPCTGEYRILPLPEVHPLKKLFPMNNYGFGYDRTIDDYKVIRNTYFHESHIYDSNNSDVQVYTLGMNSWRRIGPNPYRLHSTMHNAEGMLVNGVLYWMDYLHENIISFDIGKEKFQHLAITPNFTDHGKDLYVATFLEFGGSTLMLHVFEGSLCILRKIREIATFLEFGGSTLMLHVFEGSLCILRKIREKPNYYRVEIWVLTGQDYIAKNNGETLWTKLVTIPNLTVDLLPVKPLRYTRYREILILNQSLDLVAYDPKNNKDRNLGRICVYKCSGVVKEIYSESLVTLNSGTYTWQNLDRDEFGYPILEMRKPGIWDDSDEETEDGQY